MFCVWWNGGIGSIGSLSWSDPGVRPVINLRVDVELTGSGTTTDPFKIVGA